MIIKVCGIKTRENISFLSQANIDMVGLNFYKPSVRYIMEDSDEASFDNFGQGVKKVGVFVNEEASTIFNLSKKYKLDYIQLHGDEGPSFCNIIAAQIPIIKVFRVGEQFDFASIDSFSMASFFLFDTRTTQYGGSGKKFNWKILEQYSGSIPFLLSGGIGPDDYADILNISHPKFAGIDINSKFESMPGVKDKNLVLPFIKRIRI